MKKLCAVLLCIFLICGLCACGQKADAPAATQAEQTVPAETQSGAENPSTATAAEDSSADASATETPKAVAPKMDYEAFEEKAVFSVSENTAVVFSHGLLFYNGSGFEFEDDQISFNDIWHGRHINHFYWSEKEGVAVYKEPDRDDGKMDDVLFTNAGETTPNENFEVAGEKGVWRTLSTGEWNYILMQRNNAAKKAGFATLEMGEQNIHGIILLPDVFTDPKKNRGNEEFVSYMTAGYDANYYDEEGWAVMEAEGAVFLPAAGYRFYSFDNIGEYGYYWASSPSEYYKTDAYELLFSEEEVKTFRDERIYASPIRLVRDTQMPEFLPGEIDSRGADEEEIVGCSEMVMFGSYEQDNNKSNGKEPIEWYVLAKKDGNALLVSRYALDCFPYHKTETGVTWEYCDMRSWLNDTFLNDAFSDEEELRIVSVNVGEEYTDFGADDGETAQDKVFLLSVAETEKYFPSLEFRQCTPTEYAVRTGRQVAVSGEKGSYLCSWWLRTPNPRKNSRATDIGASGWIDTDGYIVNDDDCGVRPAIWIELSD